MEKIKYITELSSEDIKTQTVIKCLNHQGFETILIKNLNDNKNTTSFNNNDLTFRKNVELLLDNESVFVHMIICNSKTKYIIKSFNIVYEYLFNKIDTPLSDDEFMRVVLSLVELFEKGSSNITEQIGFVGELLTLHYFIVNDRKEVANFYHRFSNSKFDIEVSEKIKIEIKTSSDTIRKHKFSHSQIYSPKLDIYIASLLLYRMENSTTLYQLFDKVVNTVDDYENKLVLYKILNKLGIDENN